jgi:tRNA threonylcarbamoyladenosine modification (KEOPS) complex Cgi121 subunit
MIVLFAKSELGLSELLERSARLDALVVDPSVAGSIEELNLAFHLAKKSILKKRSLAKKLKYEFLLWLTGKTDIRSAMKKSAPKNAKDLLIVIFSGTKEHVLKTLRANEVKKSLEKNADSLRIEEISLSRIRN